MMTFFRFAYNKVPKITFSIPPHNEVLIYSEKGSTDLARLVLYDIKYSIMKTEREVIYVCPQILFFFIIFSFSKKWNYRKLKHFEGIKLHFSQLYKVYLLACINKIKPSVVITFIDNDVNFQWCSKNDPISCYIGVQNGVRTKACMTSDLPSFYKTISTTNLFCFGNYEVKLYKNYSHRVDNHMAIGSVRASYYISEMKDKITTNKFDICYVSGFSISRRNQINHPDWSRYMDNNDILTEYMERFLRESECSCCIPLRRTYKDGPEKTEELEYFQGYKINKVAEIFKNDLVEMTTYNMMYNSKVIVACLSTSLLEAFGWGKKVLFCNFLNIENLGFPLKKFFYIEEEGYEGFKETLIKLINMDYEEYYALIKEDLEQIMNYKKNYPSHTVVRNFVKDNISKSN